jgi:hypothetical protein
VTVEHDLSARLTALADDLTRADPTVSAAAVVDRHRRQRRGRAGLIAAAAAVMALVVAVPTVIGSLSADPGEAAGPGGTTTATSTGERQAQESEAAERAALQAAAEQELTALRSHLGGPVVLSAPDSWRPDSPDGGPLPADRACPDLAGPLGQALGVEISDAGAVDPAGLEGCNYGTTMPTAETVQYELGVRLVTDGTTAGEYAAAYWVGTALRHCPAAGSPEGQFLLECSGLDWTEATDLVLVVPDARGAGTWVLRTRVDEGSPGSASELLTVLVDQVTAIYG